MIDLDAIRARDAADIEILPSLEAYAQHVDDEELRNAIHMVRDRRALLACVDALRAAAEKVTCMKCAGQGTIFVVDYIDVTGEFRSRKTCPDCADLRGLLQ